MMSAFRQLYTRYPNHNTDHAEDWYQRVQKSMIQSPAGSAYEYKSFIGAI